MTLYEYRCTSCGDQIIEQERLEEFAPSEDWGHIGNQSLTMANDYTCGPLKRVWSVGFQIKSTDWGH